jgi:polyphosphate kinase
VLEEAGDLRNPLLERVKFLAISASNLDEFFEVRVGGLLQQLEDGHNSTTADGLTMVEERELIKDARTSSSKSNIHAGTSACGRNWRSREFASSASTNWMTRPGVRGRLLRAGTRSAAHSGHGRPGASLSSRDQQGAVRGLVAAPPAPLFAHLHRSRHGSAGAAATGALPSQGTIDFIFLADLVVHHAARMYKGYDIVSSAAFRVTRNSNLYLQEEESRNLLESVRAELHNRRKGDAVRMEIESDADPRSSSAWARCSSSTAGRFSRSTAR